MLQTTNLIQSDICYSDIEVIVEPRDVEYYQRIGNPNKNNSEETLIFVN